MREEINEERHHKREQWQRIISVWLRMKGRVSGEKRGKNVITQEKKVCNIKRQDPNKQLLKNALITFVIKDPERHNRFPLSNGGLWCLGHGIIITLHTYSCTCMQGKVT